MSNPLRFEKRIEIAWTDLLVAGLGGGAIHEVADQFLGRMLPAGAAIGGITLKDIGLILLGKYGAERTEGYISTALKGMAVIGVYKVVYPQFVRPLVSGIVGGGGILGAVAPAAAPAAAATPAAAAARTYVAAKTGVTGAVPALFR